LFSFQGSRSLDIHCTTREGPLQASIFGISRPFRNFRGVSGDDLYTSTCRFVMSTKTHFDFIGKRLMRRDWTQTTYYLVEHTILLAQ